MSNYRLLYSPNRKCRSETEISDLFERHAQALFNEKQRMISELIEWKKNLIRQIEENVSVQNERLEIEWKKQFKYLQIKRQEFLDTALIYEQRKDREEVRQLLEQCHALKCQLGTWEYPEQSIPFIRIQNEIISPSTTDEEQRKTTNDECVYSISLSSFSIFFSSRKLERISISTTEDHPTTNVIYDDDTLEKCPACLMIFSSAMTADERSRHVNEHFGDS